MDRQILITTHDIKILKNFSRLCSCYKYVIMKVVPITVCSPRNPIATKKYDQCVEPANRQICIANLTALILQYFVVNALGKRGKKRLSVGAVGRGASLVTAISMLK